LVTTVTAVVSNSGAVSATTGTATGSKVAAMVVMEVHVPETHPAAEISWSPEPVWGIVVVAVVVGWATADPPAVGSVVAGMAVVSALSIILAAKSKDASNNTEKEEEDSESIKPNSTFKERISEKGHGTMIVTSTVPIAENFFYELVESEIAEITSKEVNSSKAGKKDKNVHCNCKSVEGFAPTITSFVSVKHFILGFAKFAL